MCVKGPFMPRNLQPWITTGIALVGAGLIAVTPATTPPMSITGGDLTVNLTGIAAELLAGLVP